GGQRQLVIFARALVSEADVLVLDEPTSSLDLKNQAFVLDWMARLAGEGLTIVCTTHNPQHALAVSDDVLLMLPGTNGLCGRAAEVLNESALHSLYGVDLKRVTLEHGGHTHDALIQIFDTSRRPAGPSPGRSTSS